MLYSTFRDAGSRSIHVSNLSWAVSQRARFLAPFYEHLYVVACPALFERSPMTVLEEAQSLIYGARMKEYAPPKVNFSRIARLWSVIIGRDITTQEVALCMVAVKIARLMNGYKRDSVVDMAGYAGTMEMLEEPPFEIDPDIKPEDFVT